jgi:hypothetical protein
VANTLALLYTTVTITEVKSFIVEAPKELFRAAAELKRAAVPPAVPPLK